MTTIGAIWRFPVKSMGGESLNSVEVDSLGLAYDRAWSLLDLAAQKNLTARRCPELLYARAQVDSGEVVITLPDGTQSAEDSVLSAWLKRDVALRRADSQTSGTYENPVDFENDADWFTWEGPTGAFHDTGRNRVSLVSRATLGQWQLDRFRINLVLDGLNSRAEDQWANQTIRIGQLKLNVGKPIGRCVVVTRPQPGLDRNLEVLREINAQHDGNLGVGATVAHGGVIELGTSVTV